VEWAAEGDDELRDFFAAYPVVRRHAVQLRRDGTFRVDTYVDPKDFSDFFALLAAHHIIAKRRRTAEAA